MIASKRKEMVLVFLPVLLIGLWIGSYVSKSFLGQTIRLPIHGFDPRSLLSGHYLLYRVDYGEPVKCPGQQTQEWCLCLFQEVEEENWHLLRQGECETISKSCDAQLRGQCNDNGRFVTELERFYFPEKYRDRLQFVPDNASIVVSLSRSGKAVVKDLLVDGEPVFEWLEKTKRKDEK